jgi:hypothetical protein
MLLAKPNCQTVNPRKQPVTLFFSAGMILKSTLRRPLSSLNFCTRPQIEVGTEREVLLSWVLQREYWDSEKPRKLRVGWGFHFFIRMPS